MNGRRAKTQVRKMYRMADEWLISPEAEGSSRKSHVVSLLKELADVISPPQKGTTKVDLANTSSGVSTAKLPPTKSVKELPTEAQTNAIEIIRGLQFAARPQAAWRRDDHESRDDPARRLRCLWLDLDSLRCLQDKPGALCPDDSRRTRTDTELVKK